MPPSHPFSGLSYPTPADAATAAYNNLRGHILSMLDSEAEFWFIRLKRTWGLKKCGHAYPLHFLKNSPSCLSSYGYFRFIRLKNAPGFARGFLRHKSGVQWYLPMVCQRGYTPTAWRNGVRLCGDAT